MGKHPSMMIENVHFDFKTTYAYIVLVGQSEAGLNDFGYRNTLG